MRRLALILFIAAICLGGTARAVCSDGADELCIVFANDMGCDNCAQVEPFTMFAAYFVLFNPSAAGGIMAYDFDLCNEGGMPFSPPASVIVLGYSFPGGIYPIVPPPPFVLAFPTPLPWAPTVTLASMSLLVVTSDCWCFGVKPNPAGASPDQMVYVDGNDPNHIIPMRPCTGTAWDPCSMACIDCVACPPGPPIGAQKTTWGNLKAAYRD